MRSSLRLILIAAATFVPVGGCVSNPPQPETNSASPAPAQDNFGAGASAGGGLGAGGVVAASSGPLSGCQSSAGGRPGAVPTPGGPCAGGGGTADGLLGGAGGSAVPPAQAQTAEERRATLDKQLNDSLRSFDARLRKEQQKIAQERDARQVAASTTSDDAVKSGAGQAAAALASTSTEIPEKTSESRGSRTSKRGEAPSPRAGDLKSDKSAGDSNGNANSSGNGAVANERPDGNDDDVVARRLRKAAEQETDPELKDKLWKEYVEYKKNAS